MKDDFHSSVPGLLEGTIAAMAIMLLPSFDTLNARVVGFLSSFMPGSSLTSFSDRGRPPLGPPRGSALESRQLHLSRPCYCDEDF